MTSQQRQRLEALVAATDEPGRHVTLPVSMLAELLEASKPKQPRKPKTDADKDSAG